VESNDLNSPSQTGATNSSQLAGCHMLESATMVGAPAIELLEVVQSLLPPQVVDCCEAATIEPGSVAKDDVADNDKSSSASEQAPPLSPPSSSSSPLSDVDALSGMLQELFSEESASRQGIHQGSDDEWRSSVVFPYIQSTCALCLQPVVPAMPGLLPSPTLSLVVHPECAKRAPCCAGCGHIIVGKYLVRVHKSSSKPDEPYHVDCKWRHRSQTADKQKPPHV
jgi:hypothetical protein